MRSLRYKISCKMRLLLLSLLLLVGLSKVACISILHSLYRDELNEFHMNPPKYAPGELNHYAANSIKFILNAFPDVVAPAYTYSPWRTRIYHSHGHYEVKILVPLLGDDFKPLFVKSKNGFTVPNFDVVELKVANRIDSSGKLFRGLLPHAFLRPSRAYSGQSWAYESFSPMSEHDQSLIANSIPLHTVIRERKIIHPVVEQAVHPSFSMPALKGLHIADVYSPGYIGEGPRPLVLQNVKMTATPSFERNWNHFFARNWKPPPKSIELNLISRLQSHSTDLRGKSVPQREDMDLSLRL